MSRKWGAGSDLGLQVGDKVYWGRLLTTVIGKTPTGQLKLSGTSIRFYEDGTPIVGGSHYYNTDRLTVWTPEREARITREQAHLSAVTKLESDLYKWNWRRASLEDIQAVREIIAPYLRKK